MDFFKGLFAAIYLAMALVVIYLIGFRAGVEAESTSLIQKHNEYLQKCQKVIYGSL